MDKNFEIRFSEDPANDPKVFWDVIRKRKHDHSFPAMADWIRSTNKVIKATRLRKIKRDRKIGWLSISFLSIIFIFSCTYRVETIENSGCLVNFGIDQREKLSFQKLTSLQQRFTFTCYGFLQAGHPGVVSFISFIPAVAQEKLAPITRELQLLSGLRKLEISPVNYSIKESLLSTFLHKTLKVSRQEKLKGKDLVPHIQTALEKKGLGFLSMTVLDDNDTNVSFTLAGQKTLIKEPDLTSSDSLTLKTSSLANDSAKFQTEINPRKHARSEKLEMFNWLLGTWKVKYVSYPTYHHWMRMNDSSLVCFVIKYEEGDDEPGISPGFSIAYSAVDSAILSLRGIEWKFLSASNKEINFKNEITPKSANVKWSPDYEKKTWQSVISGEQNLEIVNLVRSNDINLEEIINEYIRKNHDKMKL